MSPNVVRSYDYGIGYFERTIHTDYLIFHSISPQLSSLSRMHVVTEMGAGIKLITVSRYCLLCFEERYRKTQKSVIMQAQRGHDDGEEEDNKEEEEEEDCADAQVLQMSQTCWEFKSLQTLKRVHEAVSSAGTSQRPNDNSYRENETDKRARSSRNSSRVVSRGSKQLKSQAFSSGGSLQPDRPQEGVSPVSKYSAPLRRTRGRGTTSLRALKTTATTDDRITVGSSQTYDLLVLVLQCSGLQRVASKAGYNVDLATLLVGDPTCSFFKITLWRRAGHCAARMIRAGDLVRLTRIGTTSFRGTVQANSTPRTRFRVIWRNDTFTSPHDSHNTTMLTLSQITRGQGQRQFQHRPTLSQDDDLSVPRDVACDLASWAKANFPSVTLSESYGLAAIHRGDASGWSRTIAVGSLAHVRKGIETTVRACVLEASPVERMWSWELSGGQRRKDLISRATAVLTDGQGLEMTLQLWGDLASEENLKILSEGAVGPANQPFTGPQEGPGKGDPVSSERERHVQKPVVFEITRLKPEFSFACESLVLNTTQGSEITAFASDSYEASAIIAAVVADSAAATGATPDSAAIRSWRQTSEYFQPKADDDVVATSPPLVRLFASVSDLIGAESFCGLARLASVVVRKVDVPQYAAGANVPQTVSHKGHDPSRFEPAVFYFEDSAANKHVDCVGGVASMVRVLVDSVILCELVGGLVEEDLGSWNRSCDACVHHSVTVVATSLLDGFEKGGDAGELVDVDVSCMASTDENGRVIRGATVYRLVQIKMCSV